MKIIAINKETREAFEVDDLYFFKENHIRNFKDSSDYEFRFVVERGDNTSADYMTGISLKSAHKIDDK